MPDAHHPDPASTGKPRIGCVSYLNSKPLIDGLDPTVADVAFDVPARLLDDLESDRVDVALCPVIDYQRAREPMVVVPAGGIGSEGETLTVRVFSRVPFEKVTAIHADTDSHTSVALSRVIMHEKFGRAVEMIDFDARRHTDDRPETMLLIGDKVVNARPDPSTYPHEIDLGQAWHELTDLPFVFATWMARPATDLGDLPEHLEALRLRNAERIDAIVEAHAPALCWPTDLAREYLGGHIRYDMGVRELLAMQRFWQLAADLGVIETLRPLNLYAGGGGHQRSAG